MKKLKIKLNVILLSFAFLANAQIDSFKLADYKLPNLKRKMLVTSFGLNGSNNNQKDETQAISQIFKNKKSVFNGNLNMLYSDFLYKEKHEAESKIKIYCVPTFSTTKKELNNKTNTKKDNTLDLDFRLRRNDRFYFVPKFFVELAPNFHYNLRRVKEIDEKSPSKTDVDWNMNVHNAQMQLGIKFGRGRIMQVQDARHALYIVETLKKQSRLKSEKNNEEITKLANFIAELHNQRFFDLRLRNIAEIEQLDSFLQANNYVNKADAKYFMNLNDIWSYGYMQTRLSGTRIALVAVPAYTYWFHKTRDNLNPSVSMLDTKNKMFAFDGGLEFVHQKPLNLYWQHLMKASLYSGFMNGNYTVDFQRRRDIKVPKIQFGLNHGVAYYPNTRTELNMGYRVKFLKTFEAEDLGNDLMFDATAFNMGGYFNLNYYINPRFRLHFSSNLSYTMLDGNMSIYFVDFNNNFTNVTYPYVLQMKRAHKYKLTGFMTNFIVKLSYAIF